MNLMCASLYTKHIYSVQNVTDFILPSIGSFLSQFGDTLPEWYYDIGIFGVYGQNLVMGP